MDIDFYKKEIAERYAIFSSKYSVHLFVEGMIYVLLIQNIFSKKEIDELIFFEQYF